MASRLRELPLVLRKPLRRVYHAAFVSACVLAVETLLCLVIIRKIKDTEIDWATYMQQVASYLKGERNYGLLTGDTGPLVYPAGHVYAYSALHAITDHGKNVPRGQLIFAGVYLATQALVLRLLAASKTVPLYAFPLVALSKRLHSIYLLRLFNDGVAMLPLYGALIASYHKRWRGAGVFFSFALSVKMNILLYAPVLALLVVLENGLSEAFAVMAVIVLVQVLLALPFLLRNPSAYVSSAFDLSRAFLYRWTVNWRFISEDVFLSAAFARTLLFLHLSLLALLAVRLCAPHGGLVAVTARAVRRPRAPTALAALPGRTIVTSLCVANLIGITCARSLHYQFYAWYAPQTVYLAWQTRFPTVLRLLILATIEYAWNVYPSTSASSGTLLVAHGLLIAGVLDGLHVMRRLQP